MRLSLTKNLNESFKSLTGKYLGMNREKKNYNILNIINNMKIRNKCIINNFSSLDLSWEVFMSANYKYLANMLHNS